MPAEWHITNEKYPKNMLGKIMKKIMRDYINRLQKSSLYKITKNRKKLENRASPFKTS